MIPEEAVADIAGLWWLAAQPGRDVITQVMIRSISARSWQRAIDQAEPVPDALGPDELVVQIREASRSRSGA